MKQFSLNEYFKDVNRKVVTREGKQVRIICTDAPVKNYPIAGYVNGVDNKWHGPYSWSKDGVREIASPVSSENDLFFLGEEEELDEFEKEVKLVLDLSLAFMSQEKIKNLVKEKSQRLLDLARKQLRLRADKDLNDNVFESKGDAYYAGYDKGYTDALKDKKPFQY